MTPQKFPEATTTLKKPASMTDEECSPLPVFKNSSEMISLWRPTWKERLSILFFGKVWLRVIGKWHPPVAIEGAKTVFTRNSTGAEEDYDG